MASTSIFGYVSADRTETRGMGFSVSSKSKDGIYDITFDSAFGDIPAVVANCVENQTNRGISIHVTQVHNNNVQLAVMNTSNQTAYDIAFNFIAMGPTDD